MEQSQHELLYKLFRDHEDVIGETKTTLLSLKAMITSIKQLKCDKDAIKNQVTTLCEIIKNSEPKIMPLINLIASIEEETAQNGTYEKASIEEIKDELIALFDKSISLYKSKMQKIIAYGSSLISENDFVVVHSASSIVMNSLIEAKKGVKNFRILILKQDFVKTKQIIHTFDDAAIPYIVVPEYNLIHFISDTTKVFLGASSITCDEKFIAATGTTSIVDISHLHKIPIYLLVDTLKFSYIVCEDQRIHKKLKKEFREGMEYSYIQYSHDIVELEYIDHLITENGEISRVEVKNYLHA